MHAKLLCQMDQRPTKLKGCVKYVEFWHEEHMEYDVMSRGMVNQDGKHWWYLMMQSMSKLKKEEMMVMLKASTPWKLMIVCVWCMMFGDMLNMFPLRINEHNQDKEHVDVAYGMDRPMV
jgi:hypothetical protein